MMTSKRNSKLIFFILLLFGIIFCSISLVNHYNFRTYALDLGLYNNALYDYAHFRLNDYTLLKDLFSNPFGDHFALITPLVSPLYWIFGTYTMLVVQIAGILFGGFGVYKYIRGKTNVKYIPEIAALHFFCCWGIYSALAFDFHDNVLAAMFVPWFLLFFEKEKWALASFFFILILICKENMALWMVFISLGLISIYYKQIPKLKAASIFCISSFIYFILIVKFVMPLINDNLSEGTYYHFKYTALGNNFTEALTTAIKNPFYVFSLLFENNLNDPAANGIKSELHFIILISGGFALLYRPQFLIMLIPIYAQKLFSDDFMKWGINYQYSIEFVPILSIGLFSWLILKETIKRKVLWALCITSVTIAVTFYTLEERISKWYNPTVHQFYKEQHYKKDIDPKRIYTALKQIPANAKVSAQNQLVPHIAFRDVIYQYPMVDDAEYIVLLNSEITYPLSAEDYNKKLQEYSDSEEWQTVLLDGPITILKRR